MSYEVALLSTLVRLAGGGLPVYAVMVSLSVRALYREIRVVPLVKNADENTLPVVCHLSIHSLEVVDVAAVECAHVILSTIRALTVMLGVRAPVLLFLMAMARNLPG